MNHETTNPDLLNIISLEDSEMDFEIISEKLISAGYQFNIIRVDKEREFITLIQNNKYDLILADYKLPGFDAFEALKLCNQYCPDVPFICISGSVGEIMAIELLKNGAVDYVLKDRIERLPFAVKRALEEAKEKIVRLQMEASLLKSEEKYRTIFENVQDVFYQTDLNGIIKEISPSVKHFSDFSAEELIGNPVQQIYQNPSDRQKLIQIIYEKGEVRDYELRLKTKAGEIKHTSINARLILNAEGLPDHIDGALRDITERKQTEESLQRSEERLRDIIFSSADWVWEIDENGRYTYSSQKDIELFGVSHDEIIGKSPFHFMPEDEAKRIAALFREIQDKKAPIKDLENWNIGKNGQLICLLTNGVPIFDNEGIFRGYRGVDKNITDRKLAELELIKAKEKAEESDRLKTSFLSNMSHEIRTPLNAIIGFSDLLFDSFFSQEQQMEFVDTIKTSGKNLLRIISDIMDFSRIETGLITIRNAEIKVAQLLRKIGNEHSHLVKDKGLEIRINIPDEGVIIIGDEGRITQILENFISNAIKFTDIGVVEIGFTSDSNRINFYVNDSGIGIPIEFQELIFERFRQLESAYTRKYGGNGLGLAISKQLAEIMGGHVSVESEPGKGSTFYLSVPN